MSTTSKPAFVTPGDNGDKYFPITIMSMRNVDALSLFRHNYAFSLGRNETATIRINEATSGNSDNEVSMNIPRVAKTALSILLNMCRGPIKVLITAISSCVVAYTRDGDGRAFLVVDPTGVEGIGMLRMFQAIQSTSYGGMHEAIARRLRVIADLPIFKAHLCLIYEALMTKTIFHVPAEPLFAELLIEMYGLFLSQRQSGNSCPLDLKFHLVLIRNCLLVGERLTMITQESIRSVRDSRSIVSAMMLAQAESCGEDRQQDQQQPQQNVTRNHPTPVRTHLAQMGFTPYNPPAANRGGRGGWRGRRSMCYRCGDPNHTVPHCPEPPPEDWVQEPRHRRQPPQQHGVPAAAPTPSVPPTNVQRAGGGLAMNEQTATIIRAMPVQQQNDLLRAMNGI